MKGRGDAWGEAVEDDVGKEDAWGKAGMRMERDVDGVRSGGKRGKLG